MSYQFERMDDDEVLFVNRGRILLANPTFKVAELLDALAQLISDTEGWSDDMEGWFTDGLYCEALRLNQSGWQRGRVRLRLEFCPEQQPKLLRGEVTRTRSEDARTVREDVRMREEPRKRVIREDVYARGEDYYDDVDPDY